MRLRLAFVLVVSTLAACEVGAIGPGGGGGGDDDDNPGVDAAGGGSTDAAAATYSVLVSPPGQATTLGTKTTYTVAVSGNFSGPVTLAAGGLPSSWQVAINPQTVNITPSVGAMATIEVTVPTNADASTMGSTLTVEGTAAPGNRSATAMMTVANEYVVNIASGTANGAHWGPMNGGLVRLKPGARLTIKNTDTTGHRIHTNGGVGGFNHQGQTMPAGAQYQVTVTDGSDLFYCHDHGQNTGEVNVAVQ